MSSAPQLVKPPALRPGAKVGIIAPSGAVDPAAFERGLAALRSWGYQPVYEESILSHDYYFAGTVERRRRELAAMFDCTEVSAILCARGGYGCNYLLPGLDLELVRRNPKIFLGYSDITTLLTRLADAAGLVTFHGPMIAKDFAHSPGPDPAAWQAVLGGAESFTYPDCQPLISGQAEGRLYGGCLSLLAASLGTPYEIQTNGAILFLEDIAAPPYQLDRMFMQLKLAGKLHHIRGIVFGVMQDCLPPSAAPDELPKLYRRLVGDLGVPVAYGLNFGHVAAGGLTLPIGIRVRLTVEASAARLQILESCVR
jgi:muramoyltetrapeptide carboxypeptidase